MKRKMKSAAIVLAGLMAISIFAGCGTDNVSSDTSTKAVASDSAKSADGAGEPLKVKHFFNFDWFDGNYADTAIGKELQKRTNVELEISKAPSADNQKLNLMIASNELPDLITVDKSDPTVSKMIAGGMVYALSDLIDQYAPEMRENSEPEYFKYYNWTDGKQYYFPSFVVTDNDLKQPDYNAVSGGTGMSAIRSDVYEAIGKPDMTTPDGFFNALKAAKQKFPKLTPWYFGPFNKDLTFFKAAEFQGYIFPATQFGIRVYDVDDGKVVSGVRNPKFLEFIKFMNKLYTNNLIASESFADASDISQAKVSKGNFSVMSWDVLHLAEGNKIQDNADAKWVPLPYFKDGKYFKDASGWTATFVSKKTSDPEKLMKYVSYLASEEGRQLIAWGIKGTHWDMKDINGSQVPRYIGEWDELRASDWGKFTKDGGFTTYFAFQDDYIHNKPVVKSPSEMSEYEKTVDSNLRANRVSDIALGLINPDAASAEGVIQAKLAELSKTYYPKMVMAGNESSAVAAYNEFLKKAEDLGLSKLEAAWTTKYSAFK